MTLLVMCLLLPIEALASTWPKPNACLMYIDQGGDGKPVPRYSCMNVKSEADSPDFADVNAVVSELIGKPGTISSPEFVMYYMGVLALGGPAVYYTDTENAPAADIAEWNAMWANPWITLIHPLKPDTEEDGCLSVGRTPQGVAYGCGDAWQNGPELACWKGKTYVRCQLDCYKKYRDPSVQYTAGSCLSSLPTLQGKGVHP